MIPFARSGVLIDRRWVLLHLLLVAVLAACTANPAVVTTPTPTDTQPTATASTAPSTTPSPAPPTASPPTEPPEPPGLLTVEWARAPGDPGFGDVAEIRAAASLRDRFVVVGQLLVPDPEEGDHALAAIWFSDDGRRWQPAHVEDGDKEGLEIRDVTVGGPGLLAVGQEYTNDTVRAAVWASTDGLRWARVHDDGFSPGRMWRVGATNVGLVAFGDDGRKLGGVIWTSPDGRDWLRATNESGLQVAKGVGTLVAADGGLTAFVHEVDDIGVSIRPIEVWRTSGRADWARVGELPGSLGARVFEAAQGPRGWVATGATGTMLEQGVAWTSADGIAWELAPSAPGPVSALLADEAGFLAVGARSTATGCISVGFEFVGQTWTSSDGRTWREMVPMNEWVSEGISQLLRRDQTVFGVGVSWESMASRPQGVVWTATLPARSVDTRPSPAPTPRLTPNPGCGP